MYSTLRSSYWLDEALKYPGQRQGGETMVTAWRMRTELGMEIAHMIYLYLVQKYPQGKK